jgi:hypothetical protein
MLCLMAGLSALGAVIAQHAPMTIEAPGAPQSSSFMLGAMIFSVLFYLILAAWAIATVVGLFRMKSWARISIMIIGGGLAVIGLFSTLVTAAMPMIMKSIPTASNTDPAILRATFLVIAVIWLLVTAVGISWLVYFALRRTREAFAQAALQQGLPAPGVAAVYPTPTPMTDFSVARPMIPQAPPATPVQVVPPQPSTPARPVSITIIAILMLLGALTCLSIMPLQVPAFFFGVTLPGWTGRVLYLVFACLSAITGVGLLRLQKSAWVLSLALYGVGLLNVLTMALPGVRQRLMEYQQNLTHTMGMRAMTPVLDPHIMSLLLLFGMAFDVLLLVFVIALLWRARRAFEARVDA